MLKMHNDVYYADGLGFERILIIINENIEIFRNNGMISFGIGCHETNDEILAKAILKRNDIE